MKSSSLAVTLAGVVALYVSPPASASWLSDITGINIDIPGQKFEIGTPNLAAIPQMLQHLPQDAANFFLSPGGPPLAFLIRQTEANAARYAQPMPAGIRQLLALTSRRKSWTPPVGRRPTKPALRWLLSWSARAATSAQ